MSLLVPGEVVVRGHRGQQLDEQEGVEAGFGIGHGRTPLPDGPGRGRDGVNRNDGAGERATGSCDGFVALKLRGV
jgi:hypothetical protein